MLPDRTHPIGASPAEILLALLLIGGVAFAAVLVVRTERARTRDAVRIADMAQLSAAFRAVATVEGSYQSIGATCAVGDSVSKCSFGSTLPFAVQLADPLGISYTVQRVPDTTGYAVAFTLERGFGNYGHGPHQLTEQGIR